MQIKYSNPPVNEVALAVFFKPLQNLRVPHIGLFWSQIQKEYVHCDHTAPFATSSKEEVVSDIPQCVLTTEDYAFTIRIQSDAFFFHWNKQVKSQTYPLFEKVFEKFASTLKLFREFLKTHNLGQMTAEEYRLNYENEIEVGDKIKDITQLGNLIPEWQWGRNKDCKLPKPFGVYWTSLYSLSNDGDALQVTVRNDVRSVDKAKVIVMELNTTSGSDIDPNMQDLEDWFTHAHSMCGIAFNELTTSEFQTSMWGKAQ